MLVQATVAYTGWINHKKSAEQVKNRTCASVKYFMCVSVRLNLKGMHRGARSIQRTFKDCC